MWDRGKASHEQDGGIMSSSSDIEKLFDHFGGDANAYQEIGRENEARTARTRWPLLVTLDLSQPTIPEIGQRREARPLPPVSATPAVDPQDTMPKDVASVTRAKAPLFTRSHRRDIPPVVVTAAPPAAPSGASRFGVLGGDNEAAAGRDDATAPASAAPATPFRASTPPPPPTTPAAAPLRAQASAHAQVHASTPTRAYAPAPASAIAPARSAQSTQSGTILGKLFAAQAQPTAPQPAASPANSVPLQSVFDRLRGTPAQPAAAPANAAPTATPGGAHSWLVNGPRRS
jgi:hypothetical protein